MKLLGAALALCGLLPLSRALPLNTTVPRAPGLCDYVVQHSTGIIGAFIPSCDSNGNFLPQQCSGSTGYCWCVQPLSGEEIPNTRTPPGTSPINCDNEFFCPYGWSRFGRSCYIFIHSEKQWPEAESYCRFEGANLASIHSYEEDHFIQGLSRGSGYDFPESWIGGHDAVHNGFWMWSDGSKFNYENWHHDFDTGVDLCLKINVGYDRKWGSGPCEDHIPLPFVCSKRV